MLDANEPNPAPEGAHQFDIETRASLLARLAANDSPVRELAWNEFYARYVPMISGFAKRCGAKGQDVDDIVQDVLAAFLNVAGKFTYDRSKGRFRGYLKTCAVRATVSRLGERAKFQETPLADIPDTDTSLDTAWNEQWEREIVSQALLIVRSDSQNSSAFQAFENYVLLNRPAHEVAEELNLSVNSVHQAKTRITKQLRETVRRLRDLDESI